MIVPETEIVISQGGTEILRKVVQPGDYAIGSDTTCEMQIAAEGVSRRHAQLTVNYDHALIEDLGSSNGTLVNGQPVTEPTRLWPNQKIQIGAATLELRRLKTAPSVDDSLAPTTETVRRILPDEFLREKKYDIGGVVAQGGMGAILNAKDATTERTVAMKVMLHAPSPEDMVRFIAEAKVTAQLEHPSIVPVYELSVDENDNVFYTMKFVRGITLRKILELLAAGTEATVQKYPLAVLLTVFQKVCDAIAFAHSKRVIHRDLKPDNIMIGDFGEVLVMDWGLAKRMKDEGGRMKQSEPSAVGDENTNARSAQNSSSFIPHPSSFSPSVTLAGTVMGTPQYMAPEQARGEVEAMDERADIYALGAILYHLLALRPAVTGDDAWAIVEKVARGEIEPLVGATSAGRRSSPPGDQDGRLAHSPSAAIPNHHLGPPRHLPGGRMPDSLAAVVRKAMAFEREARYASVEALQTDITAYQNGFATSAEKAGAWRQIKLLIVRHKTASMAAAVVLVLTSGFTAKVISEGRVAQRALSDLRSTAPEFAARAAELFANEKFEEADHKLEYAIRLDPKNARFRLTRANFYEAQLHLMDAIKAYREVLALDPGDATAKEHVALCEQLERTRSADGKFPRATLAQLLDAMTKENRPPAEKFAVAKLLGRENDALREVWLVKLKGLPTGNMLLNERLVVAPDGRMRLKLDGTPISDISPLSGMPLSELELSGAPVTDLGPLRGMRLEKLKAVGCRITDLTPLAGMPLRNLNLNLNRITNISALAGMRLEALELAESPVQDLSPLHGMPLHYLDINSSTTPDLNALRGLPLTTNLNLNRVRAIADLTPLAGMQLRNLVLYGNEHIDDLTPLHDCPLETLIIDYCPRIVDISPIAQPKLRRLSLFSSSNIVNLHSLSACTELEELVLPPKAKDIAFLRALPKLRNIGYTADVGSQWTTMTAGQFWKEYDAKAAGAAQK